MSSYGSKKVQEWRTRTKNNAVKALGGKCCKCGYNKCIAALAFHHIDPATKEYTIASMFKNPTKTDLIIEEIKKCALLCSNCHHELHYGEWDISEIEIPKFDESVDFYLLPKKEVLKCKGCDNYTMNDQYCSQSCARKHQVIKKINWPDIDTLQSLLSKHSQIVVADKIGVVPNSIKKHIGKYYPDRYKELLGSEMPKWIKTK